MTRDNLALTRPFRVSRLSSKVPTTFELVPDAAARAAIAAELGILGVEKMAFAGTLTPVGRQDFTLQAKLTATVLQPCILTLVPVRSTVSDNVLRRYLQDYAEPTGDEVELQDDSLEPLPETIDPGQVAIEALALLLPEYPRAPGAVFANDTQTAANDGAAGDAPPKPFAGLAHLAEKLARTAKDGPEKD